VSVIILRGDAAHLPLADESVDLIVTSPPYFGLRSYTDNGEHYAGQIGSEETPREYVANLLACTREWMRVLKPSGSIFVNLGDKYSTYTGANWGNGRSLDGHRGAEKVPHGGPVNAPKVFGIPYKSLMLLPQRYALGCVDDLGLILRAEIIWSKPNGMPESVTDRVRRSHEQVFHLVKEARDYFAGVDEIREPHDTAGVKPGRRHGGAAFGVDKAGRGGDGTRHLDGNPLGKLPGSVWEIASQPLAVPAHLGADHYAAFPMELPRRIILGWSPSGICTKCGEGRRPVTVEGDHEQAGHGGAEVGDAKRQTWIPRPSAASTLRTIAPRAIAGHACACTPYADHPERRGKDFHAKTDRARQGMNDGNGGERYRRYVEELANPRGPVREYDFNSWTPAPTRPAIVLDPFGGTGTTALVADILGRTGVTIDRSADYCRIAQWRTSDPAERARALGVPKPPPVIDGQCSLFDEQAS
jgi:hypothetical protein